LQIAGSIWLAAAPLLLLNTLVPPAFVLPVYCALATALAAAIAVYAYLFSAPVHTNRLTAWDVAGGVALIGIAAGIFSEPVHLVALFDGGAPAR
jgi:hypothetical protein